MIDEEQDIEEQESDRQSWAAMGYTRKVAKAVKADAMKTLNNLALEAQTSTDPQIVALGCRYAALAALVNVLTGKVES